MNYNYPKLATLGSLLTSSLIVCGNADASIIYTSGPIATPNGTPAVLDINVDGVDDISLSYSYNYYYGYNTSSAYGDLFANGLNGTEISFGGPISFGDLIDDSTYFVNSNHMADYDYHYSSGGYSCGRWSCTSWPSSSSSIFAGSWNDGSYNSISGYLGFSLYDNSETFYGWADITMSASGNAVLNGFAYETCSGVGINAGSQSSNSCAGSTNNVPEPSSLALLAIGSAGIGAITRRRRKSIEKKSL